jgi:hypothetical protein
MSASALESKSGHYTDRHEPQSKRRCIEGSGIEQPIDAGEPVHDPLIYPDLYSPSGFDMMGILVCAFFGN